MSKSPKATVGTARNRQRREKATTGNAVELLVAYVSAMGCSSRMGKRSTIS